MRLWLAFVVLVAGCPAGRSKKDTNPDGVTGARPVAPSGLIEAKAWDLRIDSDPVAARSMVSEDHLLVETMQRGRLADGVYSLSASRDDRLAKQGSLALARAAAEDWRRQAAKTGGELPVTFLGLDGHAFLLETGDAFGLQVHATVGECVYELVALRAGTQEELTEFAGKVLRSIIVISGKTVTCRYAGVEERRNPQ